MKPVFIQRPLEVSNELEKLGLCDEGLHQAIGAVVLARSNCTVNDVPAARGMRGWLDGTRSLRDFYCRKGWEKNEEDHISSLFHRERLIKVMVSNTDDATGLDLEDRQPQNRSKKGPATDRAVSMNQQLNLFEGFDQPPNVVRINAQQLGMQHWFLCVYRDDESGVVRAEISLPAMCEGGFFTTFLKRIVLIGDGNNDDRGGRVRVIGDGPDDQDFEINVTRKQA